MFSVWKLVVTRYVKMRKSNNVVHCRKFMLNVMKWSLFIFSLRVYMFIGVLSECVCASAYVHVYICVCCGISRDGIFSIIFKASYSICVWCDENIRPCYIYWRRIMFSLPIKVNDIGEILLRFSLISSQCTLNALLRSVNTLRSAHIHICIYAQWGLLLLIYDSLFFSFWFF